MQSDKIYIIGAGAIGKALAVFLKAEGKDVVLLRGTVDDGSTHVEIIKVELHDNIVIDATIEINTASNFQALNGVIAFTNKSFGNASLAATLKTKINNAPVVILQNGLAIEQPFIDNGYTQIYRCVLFATCQSLSPGLLRFKPVTASPIGSINGDSQTLQAIVQQMNNKHFQFKAEQNIQPLIWTKAIVNSVFNSVCPLLETDNGIFYRNAMALLIAERIINECVTIAAYKGINLDAQEVITTLLSISKLSDGQLISTYQDIRKKRQTEIETLNFAIAGIADTLVKEGLAKETKLLGELIKIKSEITINS